MTWPVLAALAVPVLFAALLAACWWGSNIVFHPPKMLAMEIWPDKYQLRHEDVEFESADGLTLSGWLIPALNPTDRSILLCHGWGDNKGDLLQHTYWLYQDFNLFYIDTRHHGESEGPLSTIGSLEARDVTAAMAFLKTARPEWTKRLGVYGLSMGGALAIWTAAQHPEIKAVATEAPFPSFEGVVNQFCTNAFRLPYFPFVWLTLAVIRWRLGEDPEPFSPIYHVDRIAPRPMFFIAGSEDRLMPLPAVKRLYEKAGQPKELWVVDGARHGKCEETAGEEYRRRMREFFERSL